MRKIGEWKRCFKRTGFELTDWVVLVLGFLSVILCGPVIQKQFAGLEKAGDVVWFVCADLLIVIVYVCVLWFVARLLRLFNRWFNNKLK